MHPPNPKTSDWGKPAAEEEEDGEKKPLVVDRPNFGLTGALAKDTRTGNVYKGVVLKVICLGGFWVFFLGGWFLGFGTGLAWGVAVSEKTSVRSTPPTLSPPPNHPTPQQWSEPDDARRPERGWRLYVFKGGEVKDTLHLHRQSAYLIGRHDVADLKVGGWVGCFM